MVLGNKTDLVGITPGSGASGTWRYFSQSPTDFCNDKAEHKLCLHPFPVKLHDLSHKVGAAHCQSSGHQCCREVSSFAAALLFVMSAVCHQSTRCCGGLQVRCWFNRERTLVTCWELSWGVLGKAFSRAQQQGKNLCLYICMLHKQWLFAMQKGWAEQVQQKGVQSRWIIPLQPGTSEKNRGT